MNEKEPKKTTDRQAPSIFDASPVTVQKKSNAKRKKILSITAAVLVVALLAGGITWLVRSDPSLIKEESSATSDSAAITLSKKDQDKVTKVTVTPADSEAFSMVRTAKETWKLEDMTDYDEDTTRTTGLANTMANLAATKVVTEKADDLAPYELDEKHAWKLSVTFSDKSSYTILVGAENPAKEGLYFKYADKDTVYLSDYLLTNNAKHAKTEFLSTNLVASWDSEEQAVINKIVLSGTSRPKPIVLEPTPTEEQSNVLASTMKLTSPIEGYVNADTFSTFSQNLFGISADHVAFIRPTDKQLAACGLDQPWSTMAVTYEGSSRYTLQLGGKDEDGNYYLKKSGVNLIYAISPDTLVWENYTAKDLHTALMYAVSITEVKAVSVKSAGKTYRFEITQAETSDGDLTVSYNGKAIATDNFKSFYQVLISSRIADSFTGSLAGAKEELAITFEMLPNKGNNITVRFLTTSAREVAVEVNGKTNFTMTRTLVDKITADLQNVIQGKTVDTDF